MEVFTGCSSASTNNVEPKSKKLTNGRSKSEWQRNAIRICGQWSEQLSSKGKVYFYNCVTERSQWQKPTEWQLPDLKREELLQVLQCRDTDGRCLKRSQVSYSQKGRDSVDTSKKPKCSRESQPNGPNCRLKPSSQCQLPVETAPIKNHASRMAPSDPNEDKSKKILNLMDSIRASIGDLFDPQTKCSENSLLHSDPFLHTVNARKMAGDQSSQQAPATLSSPSRRPKSNFDGVVARSPNLKSNVPGLSSRTIGLIGCGNPCSSPSSKVCTFQNDIDDRLRLPNNSPSISQPASSVSMNRPDMSKSGFLSEHLSPSHRLSDTNLDSFTYRLDPTNRIVRTSLLDSPLPDSSQVNHNCTPRHPSSSFNPGADNLRSSPCTRTPQENPNTACIIPDSRSCASATDTLVSTMSSSPKKYGQETSPCRVDRKLPSSPVYDPSMLTFIDPTLIVRFYDSTIQRLEFEANVESKKFDRLQSLLYSELSVESKKLRALVRISEAKHSIHEEKQTSLQTLIQTIESRRQPSNTSFVDDVV